MSSRILQTVGSEGGEPSGPAFDVLRPSVAAYSTARDGSLLRLVPSGSFLMGSTATEIEAARGMDHDGALFSLGHEMPQVRLTIPAFYIGVHAVTHQQFIRFLNSKRPSPKQFSAWVPCPDHIRSSSRPGAPYEVEPGYEQHPAIHLSWYGAVGYCEWAGLRLPTEIEWEKAARGEDGRIFPWGSIWDERKLRWYGGDRSDEETTAPVDAYPEGRSPYGLFQMAGNVEEWCVDPYRADVYRRYAAGKLRPPPTGYGRVVRGGTCLRRNRLEFRCAMRRGNDAAFTNILFTGLRCACDAPPAAVSQEKDGPEPAVRRFP